MASLEQLQLSYIVPVYFNQKRTSVLTDLLEHYAGYDEALMRKIQFVIVDDCSPIPVRIPSTIRLNYKLLRVKDDIRWNQAGARNLGVVEAACPKIILTDIDHRFPEELLRQIVDSRIPGNRLYKFKRRNQEGKKLNSPCNIFYTSKSVFFKALGYDEEFCGQYGYEDVMFRLFQKRVGNRLRYFTRRKQIVADTIDRDNSYHSLVRDTTVNFALMNRKIELLKGKDFFRAHSRLFLNFTYEKIAENSI